MSGNYSASQFDHAFKPTKLKNWQYATNPFPGKYAICSPIRCGCTGFIACDNGHLCKCSSRNCCSSPWGDYGLHIWEQTKPCCCIDKHRHPELYRPIADIYITKIPKRKCCDPPSCVVDPMSFAGRGTCCQPRPMMCRGPCANKRSRAIGSKKCGGRRRGGGQALNFRFSMGCCPRMCRKPDWRN